MKRIILGLIMMSTSALNLLADPSDHGKDYSLRESEGSNPPAWLVVLIIVVGVIAYNIFKKDEDDTSSSGCLASIISVILIFVVIYIINH